MREPMQDKAAVVVRLCDAGLERCNPIIVVERSGQIAGVGVAIRQHQQRLDVARIGNNGLGGELVGVRTVALLQQSHRQIGEDCWIVRRKPQGLAQPRFGGLEVRSIEEIQGLEEQRPRLLDIAHGRIVGRGWKDGS